MKKIIIITGMLIGGLALAETTGHQVTVTVDGLYYSCTNGLGPANPTCVQTVSGFCATNSTYDENTCYSKATTGCQAATPTFPTCVTNTASYCDGNTTMNENSCFDSAVSSCKGDAAATVNLMKEAAVGPKK